MASIDSEYDALMQELGGGERPNPMPAPEAAASKPQQQPFTLPGMQNKVVQLMSEKCFFRIVLVTWEFSLIIKMHLIHSVSSHKHKVSFFSMKRNCDLAWAAQQAAAQQAAGGYQDSSANFYSSPGAQRGKNQAYTDGRLVI